MKFEIVRFDQEKYQRDLQDIARGLHLHRCIAEQRREQRRRELNRQAIVSYVIAGIYALGIVALIVLTGMGYL